jgi:hypothetical protein
MTVADPTPVFGSSEASALGEELSFSVSGTRPDSRLARRSREAELGVVYGIESTTVYVGPVWRAVVVTW